MKFLVIVQDLRISGTSQGILERSFLYKLRKSYPNSVIDVYYLKAHVSDDSLNILPVDSIIEVAINLKIPRIITWVNKIYWRMFHKSLNENYKQKVYAKSISKILFETYDYIFIRSSGVECETILGSHNLPILRKAFITFNEPYPYFWCSGNKIDLSKLDFYRLKKMLAVVEQSKGCIATEFLARDMQFLYGTRKKFYALPHQFCEEAFEFKDFQNHFVKRMEIAISYHGALQFGRDLDTLLEIYVELLNENVLFKHKTEFFVRLKSSEYSRLKTKFKDVENIQILNAVNFSTSFKEQKCVADINISLENGPLYCSVLLGKAPLLDYLQKPFFSLSPTVSEMRTHIVNSKFLAGYNDRIEIKEKFASLIEEVLNGNKMNDRAFGNYFSDENFKKHLDAILKDEYDRNV